MTMSFHFKLARSARDVLGPVLSRGMTGRVLFLPVIAREPDGYRELPMDPNCTESDCEAIGDVRLL